MFDELIEQKIIHCPKCGQDKPADPRDTHMCVDCAKALNNRAAHLRMHQEDWMDIAKDAHIDPWLQQPGETQLEYTIWSVYRDSYPGRRLTYAEVAEKAGTTKQFVGKVAQRWTFQARMQAWMAECDRMTMAQRRDEVLHMNAEHISMAQRIRDKLSVAIDMIQPETLKPSELGSLMKLATDLERKARLDTIEVEDKLRDNFVDNENPNIKKSPTKHGDLGEVVQILLKAGALGSVTQIGVRETTTREVVAMDSVGNEARIMEGED